MSQISPMSPTKLMNQTKRIIRGLLSLILPAFYSLQYRFTRVPHLPRFLR